jgi:hypothetical protein
MGAPGGHEPRRGGIEHELEHLPSLRAYLHPAALLVYRQHCALLEAAAEVRDARLSTDAGNGP